MQILALIALGAAALLALAFGARYVLTREFMPYHATVLGRPWSQLDRRLQFIILGMLKVAGGGLLGYGVALLWLLLPIQRGEAWASWAALTMSFAALAPILYTVVWLRHVEPSAKTPVIPSLTVFVLVVLGTTISLVN
jgi:hypothetical protein